jgi:hypothetical protein
MREINDEEKASSPPNLQQAHEALKGRLKVLKKIVRTSAIVLALTALAIPVKQVQAQAPVVTGSNPVPTGENDSVSTEIIVTTILIGMLSSV